MLLTSSDTVVTSWVHGTLQNKAGSEVTKWKSVRWEGDLVLLYTTQIILCPY